MGGSSTKDLIVGAGLAYATGGLSAGGLTTVANGGLSQGLMSGVASAATSGLVSTAASSLFNKEQELPTVPRVVSDQNNGILSNPLLGGDTLLENKTKRGEKVSTGNSPAMTRLGGGV